MILCFTRAKEVKAPRLAAPLSPLLDEEPHGALVARQITHEVRKTLGSHFGHAALFARRKLMAGRLWEESIEIVPVSAIKEIDAGSSVRLAFQDQTHGLIDDGEVHQSPYVGHQKKATEVSYFLGQYRQLKYPAVTSIHKRATAP